MATSARYDDNTTFGLTLRIPTPVMDNLQEIASARGEDIHDIVLDYIREGILQSMPMAKRENFFQHTKGLLKKHNVPQEYIDEFTEKFTY